MATYEWLGTTSAAWATAGNWSPSGPPAATDDVRLPANAAQGIDGSDQSGTALGDFIAEKGFAYGLGSLTTDLKIDPNRFEFDAQGSTASYLDLHSAAINALVKGTASANTGYRGLYLQGSALAVVSIEAGSVGLASRLGESAAITTVRAVGAGADVWVGAGVTLTNLEVLAGSVRLRCAATTVKVYGGELITEEEGAITTLTIEGGTVIANSTGTIGTANVNGGVLNCLQSGLARTISVLNLNPGGKLFYDPGVMVMSAINEATAPIKINTSRA
jgi:hypothetical protein